MLRLIKAALVTAIGLHALFYAAENLANLNAASSALAYVFSGADHIAYPNHLFLPLEHPAFAWVALGVVLVGESATGLLGLKGGWDLYRARKADAAAFHAAKRAGVLSASLPC